MAACMATARRAPMCLCVSMSQLHIIRCPYETRATWALSQTHVSPRPKGITEPVHGVHANNTFFLPSKLNTLKNNGDTLATTNASTTKSVPLVETVEVVDKVTGDTGGILLARVWPTSSSSKLTERPRQQEGGRRQWHHRRRWSSRWGARAPSGQRATGRQTPR